MSYEPHDDWHEGVIDSFVEDIEAMGVELDTKPVRLYGGGTRQQPVIHWSGFWSQGDGACFAGRVSDAHAWALAAGYSASEARQIKRLFDRLDVSLNATCGNRYPNQYSEMDSPYTEKRHKRINRLLKDVVAHWDSFCGEQSHKLYRSLESEYTYQCAWGELQLARENMASARESVSDCLENVRGYRDAGMVNPDQYESALTCLESAWEAYREATGTAFEAASYAKRHHGIDWRECAP